MEIKKLERDENGLLKGIEYVFDEHGMIDWREILPKKFLYFKDEQYLGEEINNVPDNALLVYLDGIKWLAKVRGYNSIRYPIVNSGTDFVTCVCEIEWIGNYETEGRSIVHSSVGYSTLDNTSDFMGLYLGPDAENKAFIRAVTTFLRVNVCGKEEIAPENSHKKIAIRKSAKDEYGSSDVVNILEDCMSRLDIDFSTVLKTLKDDGESFENDPKSLRELHSMKPTLTMKLIGRMKKKLKTKK